jgi:hypothetical protein
VGKYCRSGEVPGGMLEGKSRRLMARLVQSAPD